jgi:hypothetical protein
MTKRLNIENSVCKVSSRDVYGADRFDVEISRRTLNSSLD